ncbi:glycosyltransferase [Pedobacter immunditicola]|uniref:glycosyltransferase n=1 Tax=Pedobacter immunditicola TaxID=3133440 RepID=UPI00309952AE
MNIVFVSLQRINTDRESTSTCLAKEFAKNHKVLYVNPPIDRKSLYFGERDVFLDQHINLIKRKEKGLTEISANLFVLNPSAIMESINWISNQHIFSLLHKRNNKKLATNIQDAINELGFDSYILINDKDILRSFYLKEILKPALHIYLDRDYMFDNAYWKRHGIALEPKLMKKSDIILCNSPTFTKNALKYNENSFYIGNGCGLDLNNNVSLGNAPEQLKNIPRPLIGYVGAITSLRLDLNLLINIAKARKDWSLVLVGPDDEQFSSSELYQLPNVHYLGKIHKNEVISYINQFDVCINPQLINTTTIGNFPLKIIEYLHCGKPVVATSTEFMQDEFKTSTYLAIGVDEYIEKIEDALLEDSEIKRIQRKSYIQKFSWDKIADRVLSIINEHELKIRPVHFDK